MDSIATKSIPASETTSLVKTLFTLQQQDFSGTVKVNSYVTETSQKSECFLFFSHGNLTFAGRKIPSPTELVMELAHHLKVGYIDSIMQYVANRLTLNRASAYELLEVITSTKAMSWEDIERIVTDRMVVILEQFLPYACTIQTCNRSDFDIAYGPDRHGIPVADILQRIGQRQKKWKQYLPAIPSIDAIPRIRKGALETIVHQPTRQHLEQWVDGKRSFADIAEALKQDPLALAPLYFRWTNERLIDFSYNVGELGNKALPVILSVDDSPIVQAMIRRSLCENYEVISANSAMDALGVLNRRDVDLILLDVTMPEIDGFEFCRTIRKMSKFKNTPVIMLTAKDGLIDRAMGHMAGTNRYLTKPVNKDELIKAIQEFIQ